MTLTLRVCSCSHVTYKVSWPWLSGHVQLNTETNSYFGRALSTAVGDGGARVVKNKTPVIFSQQNTTQSKSKSRTQKVVAVIAQNSAPTCASHTGSRGTASGHFFFFFSSFYFLLFLFLSFFHFSFISLMCTLFVTDFASMYWKAMFFVGLKTLISTVAASGTFAERGFPWLLLQL